MIAPRIDDTGDLDFDQATGVFNMVEGDDEIRQALRLLLGINVGELDWNPDIGLNHLDVMANASDESMIQSIITDYLRDQLGEASDSFEITSFKTDNQERLTSIVGTITIDGQEFNERVSIDNEAEGGDDDAA